MYCSAPKWLRLLKLMCFFYLALVLHFLLRSSGFHYMKPFQIYNRTNKAYVIFPGNDKIPRKPHPDFVILNPNLCNGHIAVSHIVVVHSAVGNFDRRLRLRNTWANPNNFKSINSRTVFILGKPRSEMIQPKVLEESSKFNDIVQGDFIDDYKNLTLKAVAGLRWVSKYCSNSIAAIKVDDDVFVNVFKAIWEVLPLIELKPRQIICSVEPQGIIFRDSGGGINTKWVISKDLFPGLYYYPFPFCYGFGVFVSTEIITDLYEQSLTTPFYRLDDVYVYGILANSIKGLTWRNIHDVYSKNETETLRRFRNITEPKTPSGGEQPALLIGTAESDEVMHEIWTIVKGQYRPL